MALASESHRGDRQRNLLLDATTIATSEGADSRSKVLTRLHDKSTSTGTLTQETGMSDGISIDEDRNLSIRLDRMLAALAVASQVAERLSGLSPRSHSIIKELSNLGSNPTISLGPSASAARTSSPPKLSDLPHVYFPPKYPHQWHVSKSTSSSRSYSHLLQNEEDLATCPPLDLETLPEALVFRRDRLPRPPTLVYGFPLDLAKFVDHVDKVCAEINLPATDSADPIAARAYGGVILLQSHLKRIPPVMIVPIHGPDSHAMVFAYNTPGYQKWNKANYKKMEEYMIDNDITDGPLELKWYIKYDRSQWEFA